MAKTDKSVRQQAEADVAHLKSELAEVDAQIKASDETSKTVMGEESRLRRIVDQVAYRFSSSPEARDKRAEHERALAAAREMRQTNHALSNRRIEIANKLHAARLRLQTLPPDVRPNAERPPVSFAEGMAAAKSTMKGLADVDEEIASTREHRDATRERVDTLRDRLRHAAVDDDVDGVQAELRAARENLERSELRLESLAQKRETAVASIETATKALRTASGEWLRELLEKFDREFVDAAAGLLELAQQIRAIELAAGLSSSVDLTSVYALKSPLGKSVGAHLQAGDWAERQQALRAVCPAAGEALREAAEMQAKLSRLARVKTSAAA